jgi:hypothetical protein
MKKFIDIADAGNTVRYRPSFGMDAPVTATISVTEANIKNGRPGFDTHGASWAYADQIVWLVDNDGVKWSRVSTDGFVTD